MMTMREALERAMGRSSEGEMRSQLRSEGMAIVDEDSMTQAIHDVFCGIMADHDFPNEKDRSQAKALLDAMNGTVPSTT
jgi:hypothetical protein